MKYFIFIYVFFFTINTQAGVSHVKNQPENRESQVTKFLSVLASFSSVHELKKDLKKKDDKKVKSIYAFQALLENGRNNTVCALCQANWRDRSKRCGGYTWHLENHLNYYLLMKSQNDKLQLTQEPNEKISEKQLDSLVDKDIAAIQDITSKVGAIAMPSSIDETKERIDVGTLVDDANTCLVCFQIRQSVEKTEGDDDPLRKMYYHINNHKNEEQRSERVCISNAEVFERHFPNLAFQSAVQQQKAFFEEARHEKSKDKESK